MKTMNPSKWFQGSFVPNIVLSNPKLSPSAKLCYGRLLQIAKQHGHCYPKQTTLAKELSLSVEQIRRILSSLEEEGFLYREVPKYEDRYKRLSTEYSFPPLKCASKPTVIYDRRRPTVINDNPINNHRLLIKDKSIKDKSFIASSIPKDKSFGIPEPPGSGFTGKLHRRSKAKILKSKKATLTPKPKAPEPLPKVPAKVRSVMKYWEGRGLHVSREGTKAHRDSIKKVSALFAGRAFNHSEFEEYQRQKFSIKDIKKAVDRFALAALNPHYLPIVQYKKKLRAIPIGAFIYSPFAQNGTGRSQFIHYLENAPVVTGVPVEPLEDSYPKMTSALKRVYKKEVLGGVEPKMDVKEENHFVMASQKLIEFVKKNRGKLKWHQSFTPSVLADWMVEALRKATGDDFSKVSPGWFSSEMMFNRRLPAYLSSQALLGEEVDLSGGTRVGFLH